VEPREHGTLFKVTAQGAFSLLFNFTFKTSGTAPQLTLLQHTNGLLYGDTFDGGTVIEEGGGQYNGQGTPPERRRAGTPDESSPGATTS
jgi:hypothetical protein